MVKRIYAFKKNEDGSILDVIASHSYDNEVENQREIAIDKIEKEIQNYNENDLFILDAERLYQKSIISICK